MQNDNDPPGPEGSPGQEQVSKRPLSITIVSWLFVAVGVVGVVYHAREFNAAHPLQSEVVVACVVRLLAIVGGVFMLRGRNWARWLLVAWIAFHVVLSAFHSTFEVVVHSLLFGVIVYFLFRAQAAAYFRTTRSAQPAVLKTDEPQV